MVSLRKKSRIDYISIFLIMLLINGKENKEFENYVFNDLDKMLISYGDENEEVITSQLNSITSFAALH